MKLNTEKGDCRMKYYIKQNTADGKEVFTVLNEVGQSVYHVLSDESTLYSKLILLDEAQNVVAKINRIGVIGFSRFDINIDDKECARITQNLAAKVTPKFKIHGVSWHFRGNMLLRTFDVLNVDHSIVMTHGRNWGINGECFAVDISLPQNEILCLCIAVVIDSIVMGGIGAALPVGN